MRKIIKRKIYDTDTAKQLSFKYIGEYGDSTGYEERLYMTNRGLYFVYGIGGADSPYPRETIKPVTKEEVDAWEMTDKTEGKEEIVEKKAGKGKKSVKAATEPKVKKPRKPAVKKAAKVVEPAADADVTADENGTEPADE